MQSTEGGLRSGLELELVLVLWLGLRLVLLLGLGLVLLLGLGLEIFGPRWIASSVHPSLCTNQSLQSFRLAVTPLKSETLKQSDGD